MVDLNERKIPPPIPPAYDLGDSSPDLVHLRLSSTQFHALRLLMRDVAAAADAALNGKRLSREVLESIADRALSREWPWRPLRP